MAGIKIKSHKEMSKDSFTIYNKPKYIYIPLMGSNDQDITVFVKKGDYVCKGEMVARRKGAFSIPFHTSVSGTVIGFEEKLHHSGTYVRCIKIENDLKERVEESLEIKENLSKEEFIETIKNAGIIGMGGAGFPTYIKYQTDQKIKTLIVNAVECEPYITADYTLGIQKAEAILETIDRIMEINEIEKAFIAVKKNNQQFIQAFQFVIGTYVNIEIKIVPDCYPMGWEKMLVKTITKKTYQKLPIEIGVVVNNLSTIYAIHQALTGIPLIERIITITGDLVKKPQNVQVKIGTPLHEVIEAISGMKRHKDVICIAGGPMMGNALKEDDVIVTADLNGLILLKEKEECKEHTCMRCGKCINVCPAGIEPVLIKESYQDKEQLNRLQVGKCIECGLCSYICPAKINVREYVRKAKKTVRKETANERIS